MDRAARMANAIRKHNKSSSPFTYGIWLAAEVEDANLSQVLVPGAGLGGEDMTFRFVPKGEHVTGLTNPSTVLMGGSPLCIIAKVVGDISLAAI